MHYSTTFRVPASHTTGPHHLAEVVAAKAQTASVVATVPDTGTRYTAGRAPIAWQQTPTGDYLLHTSVEAAQPADAQRFDMFVRGELNAEIIPS